MAHITIARPSMVKDKEKVVNYIAGLRFEKITFKVSSFSLIKSELSQKGPKYELIEKYGLS